MGKSKKSNATQAQAKSNSEPPPPTILPTPIDMAGITEQILDDFLDAVEDNNRFSYIGIAAAYGTHRKLEWLAFCRRSKFLIIRIPKKSCTVSNGLRTNASLLLEQALSAPGRQFIAFDADKLAVGLDHECGVRIAHCVHVQSIVASGKPQFDSLSSMSQLLSTIVMSQAGVTVKYSRETHRNVFNDRSRGEETIFGLRLRSLAAWAMQERYATEIKNTPSINTFDIPREVMNVVSRIIRECDQLENIKPTMVKHDFDSIHVKRDGKVEVKGSRYKSRVREAGPNQLSVIKTKGDKALLAVATNIKGKTATLGTKKGNFQRGSLNVKSIMTFGKEAPTSSEAQIRALILGVLCGKQTFFTSHNIIRHMFHHGTLSISSLESPIRELARNVKVQLNDSQRRATIAFCATEGTPSLPTIQLVHGPPGTGKTTMITAMIQWLAGGKHDGGIYVVTQSNVAVKNVAEKLFKEGFRDFRLIVSEEFHFEWHEHLYKDIQSRVIKSSNLPKSAVSMQSLIGGAKVILCTLSMLSNPTLWSCGLTKVLLPPKTLIVDEASQIHLPSYLPSLTMASKTLTRICFVGDHKQLAPFGQSDVPELQSIFEVDHLVKKAYFLDTQYRMPLPIGRFISRHVYEGRLQTSHLITDPSCVRLVDVSEGEEVSESKSPKNIKEVQIAIHIAQQFQREGKKYRILTGYDAQRQELESALKKQKLKWEDIVFNVDSFQGNEADYVIISMVRTASPGFMSDYRRTNVLLSRCKVGMVVLAKRSFLMEHARARETLVAKLAKEFGAKWLTTREILNGARIFR